MLASTCKDQQGAGCQVWHRTTSPARRELGTATTATTTTTTTTIQLKQLKQLKQQQQQQQQQQQKQQQQQQLLLQQILIIVPFNELLFSRACIKQK